MDLNTKPLTIVFCLPGSNFSFNFLKSWSDLLISLSRYNIAPKISMAQGSNVHFVRTKCLGADVLKGKNQKPFNGKVDYDYLMWIDSDIVYSPKQVIQLISHKKDVVSGLYLMEGGKQFATVEHCDNKWFKKNGSYKFLTPQDIENKDNLIQVDYTGFGFLLIKKGVFESLEYPWFKPTIMDIGDNIIDMASEDASFCFKIREKGYNIYIDPTVKVGHEKKIIL